MSAIGFEIPVDIRRIVAGLERFVRAEVLPRHEKHAGLLDDPRKRYTPDGRYVPAVVDKSSSRWRDLERAAIPDGQRDDLTPERGSERPEPAWT